MSQLKNKSRALNGNIMSLPIAKTSWVHYAQAGVSLDDVLKPDYWANVASRFRMYDKIEVIFDEYNCWAEFLVVKIDNVSNQNLVNRTAQWAVIELINSYNLPLSDKNVSNKVNTDELDEKEYFVKYLNPHKRYAIIRASDNSIIEEGIHSKEEAANKMKQLPQ